MFYKNIAHSDSGKVKSNSGVVLSQRKLRLFSMLFCLILSLSVFGISPILGVGDEVRRITASWQPNISEIGKLKFVTKTDKQTELEVMANISQMDMPFEYSYVEQASSEMFLINGLGATIVKSCLAGTVEKISESENKKSVTIAHGKGLTSVYKNLDSLGVKEGDSVDKNTPIGIANNSQIYFQVLYKSKVVAGLKVENGELTFL